MFMIHSIDDALRALPLKPAPVGSWDRFQQQLPTKPQRWQWQKPSAIGAFAASVMLAIVVIPRIEQPAVGEPTEIITASTDGVLPPRKVYTAEAALKDALLEEQLNRVNTALAYSDPQEQLQLISYKQFLDENLTNLRAQASTSDPVVY